MHKRLKRLILVALLVAGTGTVYQVLLRPALEQSRAERLARHADFESCQQAARMMYDVHWAAACATQVGRAAPGQADGHPECDLPDDKAAVINAWLDEAERRCTAEVRAGLDR